MNTCDEFEKLPESYKAEIRLLIRRMKGKSHVADITIEQSDLRSYEFKVTVSKYNSRGSRGWATIGYIRHDIFKGDRWRLTYQPRRLKGETTYVGRTGSYT